MHGQWTASLGAGLNCAQYTLDAMWLMINLCSAHSNFIASITKPTPAKRMCPLKTFDLLYVIRLICILFFYFVNAIAKHWNKLNLSSAHWQPLCLPQANSWLVTYTIEWMIFNGWLENFQTYCVKCFVFLPSCKEVPDCKIYYQIYDRIAAI